jgi:tetratricopeptide (TPR) repeat protein
MKTVASTLILALALSAPVAAQNAAPGASDPSLGKGDLRMPDSATADERRAARLDLMFGRLAKATTKRRADRIARNIMRQMLRSGSPTADFLMERAAFAIRAKELGRALDFLDGVVRNNPEFAEGWNRRATVHFMRGDYGRSLADIEQVLKLEPRHWGALSGLAIILASLERKAEAVEVMDKTLKIHPHLEELAERRDKLRQELQGSDI